MAGCSVMTLQALSTDKMARTQVRILLTFVILSVSISLVYYAIWSSSSPTIFNEFERLQNYEVTPALHFDSAGDEILQTDLTLHEVTRSVRRNVLLDDDDIKDWLGGNDNVNDDAKVVDQKDSIIQDSFRHLGKIASTTSARSTDNVRSTVRQFEINERSTLQQDLSHSNDARNFNSCSTPLFSRDGLIRNCITSDIIGQVPADLKGGVLRSPAGPVPESGKVRRQSFQKVFDTRAWGHDWDAQYKGLNASGMGATLPWTQEAIAGLHAIISQLKQSLGVKRVRLLDVPCGDMAWMSRFLKTRDDIDYTGVDIVPPLIENHRRAFKQYRWKFFEADVLEAGINATYDVILCRTLLQHLYFYDVTKLLKVFSKSGSRYLLTTSWYRHVENVELQINDDNPGRFRQLNLEIPPISLVPPLCVHRDGPPDVFEGWDHFLGLWALPLKRVRRCPKVLPFTLSGTDVKFFSCTDWTIRDVKKH